jgi:hypothetical protein
MDWTLDQIKKQDISEICGVKMGLSKSIWKLILATRTVMGDVDSRRFTHCTLFSLPFEQ